jgi:DNA helicase-2/ATP-dependent DNA helicase PcrA
MLPDSAPPSFDPLINLRIDYARELNPQQRAAVTAAPGPALVIAGAGAGKTRTLIYRVAFLLEQGIPADRILLLTFTNKAAKEMMRRVSDLLGGDIPALWGGTFHSVGNRILRRHADVLGYTRDFTILDREDARDLIAACLDEEEFKLNAPGFPKPDVLADIFSLGVNTEEPIPQVLEAHYDYFSSWAQEIEEMRRRYAERKRAGGVVDFDDLLVLWLKLLREHAEIREQYQRRFQFILVDEYQDTNKLQSDLIDLLAARHHNVMVVGDDSQSIYSWRGANFRNILQFPKRYPEARIYKIETNYRSTPEILSLANAAIAANVHQFGKQLTTTRASGVKPVLVPCVDAGQQAAFVARRALVLREEGIPLNDMAVLYRSHFHALELQLELTRRNIPYAITSGIRVYEQAHIKDVAAYLRLVCNPRDELAFKRLTKLLPGVGGKRAEKLWSVFDAERATRSGGTRDNSAVADSLQACASCVPKKAISAWAQFADTIVQLEEEPVRSSPSKMIRLVFEAVYEDYLRDHYTHYRSRQEDLDQLAGFSRQFSSTEEFLSQLALLTNLEAEDDRPDSTSNEQIRLSTIHQAKGLEFLVVFVIMLCDGLFPSARSMKTPEDEEEERRLFYVAITRAKNELYLSYPLMRFAQSKGGDAKQQPSRFLNEIPGELRQEWNLGLSNPYG